MILSLILASATFLSASSAFALFLTGPGGSQLPFNATYQQGPSLSFDRVLSVRNQSLLPVSIFAWQLDLELQPTPGANGTLKFTAVSAPDEDPLFVEGIGPGADEGLDTNHLKTSDADMSIAGLGRLLLGGEWGNIVKLTITASPNASGTFELVSPVFNPMVPEGGSSWLPTVPLEPEGFENSDSSSTNGFVLLGTININGASVPGDYTGDSVVDGADYNKWRSEFGQTASPPSSGSDGNINGVVDAADYVVWRENQSVLVGAGSAVPEPCALTVTLILLGLQFTCLGNRVRRPDARRLIEHGANH